MKRGLIINAFGRKNVTREIKFRAWDDLNKEMKLAWHPRFKVDGYTTEILQDDILMQFTGLKDKTGKEIYEGDIVEWSIYEDAQDTVDGIEAEIRIRDSIAFSNGCFKCDKRTELLFNKMAPHRKIEVIGNIYENPELLAVK